MAGMYRDGEDVALPRVQGHNLAGRVVFEDHVADDPASQAGNGGVPPQDLPRLRRGGLAAGSGQRAAVGRNADAARLDHFRLHN